VKILVSALSTLLITLLVFPSFAFADDPLTTGKAAFDRGDYQSAIEAFREATQKEKKDPRGFFWLGTAYFKADSMNQAEAALVQGRDLDTANALVYETLGDVYMKQNLTAAAILQYKQSTQFDSMKANVYMKLAEALRKTRLYTDMAKVLGRITALDTMNVYAYRELSMLFVRGNQWANAAAMLERLTRLRPDSLPAQIQYVKALNNIKAWPKIKPVAEKILERDSTQAEIKTILGEAYFELKEYDKAKQFLGTANQDSLSVTKLISLGKSYKNTEEYEKAIDAYRKAYQKDSVNCEIPYDLGILYMKVKHYPDAIAMFQKKLQCDTSNFYQFACHLNIGMLLMQMKQFKEAKEHVQKAIELKPDNVQAWQTLAQVEGQLEQIGEEIAAYKKVIEFATAPSQNGDAAKYNAQLQEAYRMIGVRILIEATKIKELKDAKPKYAECIPYLLKALQFDTKNCEILLWIAQAYQNSNNKDEAKRFYCKLIEGCPKTKEGKKAQETMDALNWKCGK
jgi:tetratricopeptide (TPR) repeat protein